MSWSVLRSRAATASALLVAAWLILSPSPAAAETPSPPVEVRPSTILIGDTATLANQTALPLTVDVALTDTEGAAVPSAGLSARYELPPGGAVPLPISSALTGGDYELVVTVPPTPDRPAGAVVRAPVGRATPKPPKPAVTAWQATHRALSPTPYDGSDQLPIDAAACPPTAAKRVGTLAADGRSVPVTATCDGAAPGAVRLDFGPIPWTPTTYTGTIDFAPGTAASKPVGVTLVSTTSPWLQAVLLLSGVAAALALEWGRRVWRPRWQARDGVRTLQARLSEEPIDKPFQERARTLGLVDVATWHVDPAIGTALDGLAGRLAIAGNADGAETARVVEETGRLDCLVAAWRGAPDRIAALRSVLPRLDAIPRVKAEVVAAGQAPDAWTPPAMTAYLAALERDFAFALGWPADALADVVRRDAGRSIPEVVDLCNQLATAETRAAARAVVAANLDEAYAAVARADAPERRSTAAPAGGSAASGPPRTFTPIEPPAPARLALAARRAVTLFDWLLAGVALVGALLAGGGVLKAAGPFAGPWSVLAALTWGVGATLLIGQLLDAVLRARSSTRRLREPLPRPT